MRKGIIHLILNMAASPSTTLVMKMKLYVLLPPFLLAWQMQNLLSGDCVRGPVLSAFCLILLLKAALHWCYSACSTGEEMQAPRGPTTSTAP